MIRAAEKTVPDAPSAPVISERTQNDTEPSYERALQRWKSIENINEWIAALFASLSVGVRYFI